MVLDSQGLQHAVDRRQSLFLTCRIKMGATGETKTCRVRGESWAGATKRGRGEPRRPCVLELVWVAGAVRPPSWMAGGSQA